MGAAPGKFISFEGGEGTGKSTQIKRLAGKLRGLGIDVVETREPGGTKGAEIVRRTILSGRVEALGPFAEALLVNAARDDHLNEVIRPALKAGKWVLCDRFADSTRAYQGTLGGIDRRLLEAFETAVIGDDWPDLTLILDLDPHIGLERARAVTRAENGGPGGDRFEDVDLESHRKLRDAFLAIARREPERCVVIDASESIDAVGAAIWTAVADRIALPGKDNAGTKAPGTRTNAAS
ncbi:dTMP kinase [Microbaculum marinisediminis]|uniref:Thymidylate kinase n=1 Tax=Microbaculum marinisediminis TaxID=2931392 RepID=A0AAW5R420_9HYPH|nr:dTMP kinase [Microbaculum sp. A6E488]MCT8974152.1 dTMP kinase [Microbaculum sp. A6E488]